MADTFRGDSAHLCECIDALLSLDASGSLVPHGIGGHARTLLESAASRLRAISPAGGDWVIAPREMSQADCPHKGAYSFRDGWATGWNDCRAAMLSASPQQEPGATINVNEIDSKSIADPSGQTLAGAGGAMRQALQNAIALWGHRCTDCTQLVWLESAEKALATSAGTTGDDSEDAARYRWLRNPGHAIVYALDTVNWNEAPHSNKCHYSYETPEQLDASIDAARRAREVG